jgi:F-type H+-transporting ATPase subunit delta
MKRNLKEIADLTSENLNEANLSRLAKTVWIELQSNKKFNSLDQLLARVRRLQAEKAKSKIAEITSAEELEPADKAELLKRIEQKVNNKILPIYRLDRNLLGGIKVKVEDELLDISWRGKLQLIQAKLEGKL